MSDNKNDKNKADNNENESGISWMPIGMCLGVSIGVAIGAAMDNIGIGMCFGVSIGMLCGVLIDSFKKKQNNDGDK